MRQMYSDKYPPNDGVYPESTEKVFAQTVKDGSGHYPSRLYGRIDEFTGVMVGWVPEKGDPQYTFRSNYLSESGIRRADELAEFLSKKEPFYRFQFPPRGVSVVGPWVLSFMIDYAISKGLDHLLDKLRSKDAADMARDLSIEWGNDNGDSLGEITVQFSDGSTFTIQNYPHSIERITAKQLETIHKEVSTGSRLNVLYDAWGRLSIEAPLPPGSLVDIGR